MCFLQFFRDPAIAVTSLAFIVNATYFIFYFGIFVRLWILKLLAVIVVGAAGNVIKLTESEKEAGVCLYVREQTPAITYTKMA